MGHGEILKMSGLILVLILCQTIMSSPSPPHHHLTIVKVNVQNLTVKPNGKVTTKTEHSVSTTNIVDLKSNSPSHKILDDFKVMHDLVQKFILQTMFPPNHEVGPVKSPPSDHNPSPPSSPLTRIEPESEDNSQVRVKIVSNQDAVVEPEMKDIGKSEKKAKDNSDEHEGHQSLDVIEMERQDHGQRHSTHYLEGKSRRRLPPEMAAVVNPVHPLTSDIEILVNFLSFLNQMTKGQVPTISKAADSLINSLAQNPTIQSHFLSVFTKIPKLSVFDHRTQILEILKFLRKNVKNEALDTMFNHMWTGDGRGNSDRSIGGGTNVDFKKPTNVYKFLNKFFTLDLHQD